MKIKSRQEFEMAQKVARHAINYHSEASWNIAKQLIRKAYGL